MDIKRNLLNKRFILALIWMIFASSIKCMEQKQQYQWQQVQFVGICDVDNLFGLYQIELSIHNAEAQSLLVLNFLLNSQVYQRAEISQRYEELQEETDNIGKQPGDGRTLVEIEKDRKSLIDKVYSLNQPIIQYYLQIESYLEGMLPPELVGEYFAYKAQKETEFRRKQEENGFFKIKESPVERRTHVGLFLEERERAGVSPFCMLCRLACYDPFTSAKLQLLCGVPPISYYAPDYVEHGSELKQACAPIQGLIKKSVDQTPPIPSPKDQGSKKSNLLLKGEAAGKAEQRRKVKEEAERKVKEEAERKVKEEAERKVKEEAERKVKEEAECKVKEEAERKVKEESERKVKEEAERKVKEEAERKVKEESERKVKEEAERKVKEESERKAKQDAERKAKEEAERKAKEEAERKAEEKKAEKKIRAEAKKAREAEVSKILEKSREEDEKRKEKEAEKARKEAEKEAERKKVQEEQKQKAQEEKKQKKAEKTEVKTEKRKVEEQKHKAREENKSQDEEQKELAPQVDKKAEREEKKRQADAERRKIRAKKEAQKEEKQRKLQKEREELKAQKETEKQKKQVQKDLNPRETEQKIKQDKTDPKEPVDIWIQKIQEQYISVNQAKKALKKLEFFAKNEELKAQRALGFFYSKDHRYLDGAIKEDIKMATQLLGEYVKKVSQVDADTYFQLGKLLANQPEKLHEAWGFLEAAFKVGYKMDIMEPKPLAELFFKEGKLQESVKLIEKSENRLLINWQKGRCALVANDLLSAINYFEQALPLVKNSTHLPASEFADLDPIVGDLKHYTELSGAQHLLRVKALLLRINLIFEKDSDYRRSLIKDLSSNSEKDLSTHFVLAYMYAHGSLPNAAEKTVKHLKSIIFFNQEKLILSKQLTDLLENPELVELLEFTTKEGLEEFLSYFLQKYPDEPELREIKDTIFFVISCNILSSFFASKNLVKNAALYFMLAGYFISDIIKAKPRLQKIDAWPGLNDAYDKLIANKQDIHALAALSFGSIHLSEFNLSKGIERDVVTKAFLDYCIKEPVKKDIVLGIACNVCGVHYHDQGVHENYLKFFESGLKFCPDSESLKYFVGNSILLHSQGRSQDEIEHAKKLLLDACKINIQALYVLGRFYDPTDQDYVSKFASRSKDEALSYFKKAAMKEHKEAAARWVRLSLQGCQF